MPKPGRSGTSTLSIPGIMGTVEHTNTYLAYEMKDGTPFDIKSRRRSSAISIESEPTANSTCPTLPHGAQTAPEYASAKLMGAVEGALTDMLDQMPESNHVGTLAAAMRAYGDQAMGSAHSGYAKQMIPVELPLSLLKGSYAEKVRERFNPVVETSITIGSGSLSGSEELSRSNSEPSLSIQSSQAFSMDVPGLNLPGLSETLKLNILLEPRSQQKASLKHEREDNYSGAVRRLSSGALRIKLTEMANTDELNMSLRPMSDIRPLPINCTRAGRLPLFGLHCPHINDIEQTCKHLYDEGFRKHVTILFCLEEETVFIDGVPHVGNKWRSTCQEFGTKIPFAPFEEALQNAILDTDISQESAATGMKTFANCDTLDDVVEHVSLKCKVQRIACTRLAIPKVSEHPHSFLSMDLVDSLNVIADRFVVSQSPEAALIVCNFSVSPLPGGLIQSALGTALYAHSDRFTVYSLGDQPNADTFQSTLAAHDTVLESRTKRDKKRDIITANLRRQLTADNTPPERRQNIQDRIKQMHVAELRRIARRAEEDEILLSQIRRKELNTMLSIQAMARGLVVRFRRRQERKLEAKKFAAESSGSFRPATPVSVAPPPQEDVSTMPGTPHAKEFSSSVDFGSPIIAASGGGSILASSPSAMFKMDASSGPVPAGRRRRRVTMGEDEEQSASPKLPLGKGKTLASPTSLRNTLMGVKAEKVKSEEEDLPKRPVRRIDPKARYLNEALYAPIRHIIHEMYNKYDDVIAMDPPYRGKSITKKVSVWSHHINRIRPASQDDISSEDECIEVNLVDTFTPTALKSLKPVKVSIGTGMALNRQHKDVVDPHRMLLNMMKDCNCDQRNYLFSVYSSFSGSSNLQKKGYRTIRDIATLLLNSIHALLVSTEHPSTKGCKSLSNWLIANHPLLIRKLTLPDLLAQVTPVGGIPRISKVGPCEMDVSGPFKVGWVMIAAKPPIGAPLPWMTLQQTEEASLTTKHPAPKHHCIDFSTFLTDGGISARTARSQHTSEWWYTHFVSEEARSVDVLKTSTSFFHRSIPVFAFYEPLPASQWQEVACNMPFYSSSKWISTTKNYLLYIDETPYALVRRSVDDKTVVPPTARIRPHTPPRPKTPPLRVSPRRQSNHTQSQRLEPKPPSEHRSLLGRSNSGVHLPTTAAIARMASTLGGRGASFRSGSKTANQTPIGKRRSKKSQDSDSSPEEEALPLEDLSDLTGFGNRPLNHTGDIFIERNADITAGEEKWLGDVSWVEAEARFAAHLIKATPKESGLFPAFEPATCGDAQTNPQAYNLEGCNLSESVVRVAHPPPPPKADRSEPMPSFGLARRRTHRLNVEIVAPEATTPEPAVATFGGPPATTEPVPISVRGYSTAIKESVLKKSPVDAHFLRCPIIPGTANLIHGFNAVIQEVRTATSSAAVGIGLDCRDNVVVLGIALVTSCHEKGLCDQIVDEIKELMLPPVDFTATATVSAVSFGDEGRAQQTAAALQHTLSMRMPHTMKTLPFVNLIGQLYSDDFEEFGINWDESVLFVDSLLTRTGLYSQLRQPIDDMLAFNEEVRLGNIHVTERHERLAVRRRILEAFRTAEGYLSLLLTHAFLTSRWLRRNAEATFLTFFKEVPCAQNIIRNVDIFAGTNQTFASSTEEVSPSDGPLATFLDIDSLNKVCAFDTTTGPEGAPAAVAAPQLNNTGFGDIEKSMRHRNVGFLVDPHYGAYSGWDVRWAGNEAYVHTIQ